MSSAMSKLTASDLVELQLLADWLRTRTPADDPGLVALDRAVLRLSELPNRRYGPGGRTWRDYVTRRRCGCPGLGMHWKGCAYDEEPDPLPVDDDCAGRG